jgi:hypothetical protein
MYGQPSFWTLAVSCLYYDDMTENTRPCVHSNCDGVQTLVPNPRGDRSMADPPSRYKWSCDRDSLHTDEDPGTMPRDTTRTITQR